MATSGASFRLPLVETPWDALYPKLRLAEAWRVRSEELGQHVKMWLKSMVPVADLQHFTALLGSVSTDTAADTARAWETLCTAADGGALALLRQLSEFGEECVDWSAYQLASSDKATPHPLKHVKWLPKGGTGGGTNTKQTMLTARARVLEMTSTLEGICQHMVPEKLGTEVPSGESRARADAFEVEGVTYVPDPSFACHPTIKLTIKQLVKDAGTAATDLGERAELPREGVVTRLYNVLTDYVFFLEADRLPPGMPDGIKQRLGRDQRVARAYAEELKVLTRVPAPGSRERVPHMREAWRLVGCGVGLGCYDTEKALGGCKRIGEVQGDGGGPSEEEEESAELWRQWRANTIDESLAARHHRRAKERCILLAYDSRELLSYTGGYVDKSDMCERANVRASCEPERGHERGF